MSHGYAGLQGRRQPLHPPTGCVGNSAPSNGVVVSDVFFHLVTNTAKSNFLLDRVVVACMENPGYVKIEKKMTRAYIHVSQG